MPLTGNLENATNQAMSLPHPRDGTHTALGIKTMRKMFKKHGRKGVPRVGVVITDGISKNTEETAKQSDRARKENVNMFAVGVTQLIAMNELKAIASSPAQVLKVNNFDELARSMGSLVMLVCPSKF